jgi:hypothetical protein
VHEGALITTHAIVPSIRLLSIMSSKLNDARNRLDHGPCPMGAVEPCLELILFKVITKTR